MTPPDYIPVGHSVRLVSTRELGRAFGMTEKKVRTFLGSIDVPLLVPDVEDTICYVNLFALETSLFLGLWPDHLVPDRKKRPGLMAYLQSMAALDTAALDKEVVRDRILKWSRSLKELDRRRRKPLAL